MLAGHGEPQFQIISSDGRFPVIYVSKRKYKRQIHNILQLVTLLSLIAGQNSLLQKQQLNEVTVVQQKGRIRN